MMKMRIIKLGLVFFALSFPVLRSQQTSYGLGKQIYYDQSSATNLNIDPQTPYGIDINLGGYGGAPVLPSSTVTLPAGATGVLAFSGQGSGLNFSQGFAAKTGLDRCFPNGTYNFTLITAPSGTMTTTGTLTSSLTVTGDDYPSVLPRITNTNWSGNHLVVNPTGSFTFTWPAFTGTNSNAQISFQIYGTNVNSPFLPADGAHNSYTISANTLAPNSLYQGVLNFSNFETGSSNSSLPGAALFMRVVYFLIQTGTVSTPSTSTQLYKEQALTQTSTLPPVASTTTSYAPGPYNFRISSSTAGSVVGPTGTYTLNFNAQSNNGSFEYNSAPTTVTSLNTLYPEGTYTLNDGLPLTLSGTIYPNKPGVTMVNFKPAVWNAQGQLVLNPDITNTIFWTAFATTSGSLNFSNAGHEDVEIEGNNTGNLQHEFAGVGETRTTPFTNYVIPAQSLTDGNVYYGRIHYFLACSVNGQDAAGYQTSNNFAILAQKPSFNGVSKTIVYLQNSNNTLTYATGDVVDPAPYSFGAFGYTPGILTGPTGTAYSETYQAKNQPYGYASPAEATQANLDTAYPDGLYTLPNGAQVTLTGQGYPSTNPKVLLVNGALPTWTNGQLALNPLIDNVLTFSPDSSGTSTFTFATGGEEDFEIFGNQDSVDLKKKALGPEGDSTFTTMTIPANTMTPGNTYTGVLDYFLASSVTLADPTTNSYNVAGYQRETYFTVAATKTQYVLVQKEAVRVQTSNSAPVGAPASNSVDPGPFNLYAEDPTAETLTGPSGTFTLSLGANHNASYSYQSSAITSMPNLNTAYPNGIYTFSSTGTVNLSGGVFPNIPQVTLVNNAAPVWNGSGQLVLNGSQTNTITFTTYSGLNANYNYASGGYESIELYGTNDSVDLHQQAIGFNGDAKITTLTIPAGTLKAGNNYTGTIGFTLFSSINFNSATNTYRLAGFENETYFNVSVSTGGGGGG